MSRRIDAMRARSAMLRSLISCGIALSLGACTLVGVAAPAPPPPPAALEPEPVERAAPVDAVRERRDAVTAQVVEIAVEAIGTPYEWGGIDANGFDCSGLIRFAYGKLGIHLPRTSTEQMDAGALVVPDPSLLRPGDVLGFSDDGPGTTRHVGLYIGADEFIHSSSSGVRISNLRNPYWREKLVAARRFVE